MVKLSPASSTFLHWLRFLAAQAVLLGHLIHSHQLFLFLEPPHLPYMQNLAVVVFFLLSGLLIPTSTFFKKEAGNYGFIDFFNHRLIRFYAAFLPAVVLVIILDGLSLAIKPEAYLYGKAFDLKTLMTNLLMLQYFPSIPFGSGRPFWALPLWWWTYLSFGWLTLAGKFIKKQPLFWVCILALFSVIPLYSFFAGRGRGLVAVWLMGVLVFLVLSQKKLAKIKPIFGWLVGLVFWLLAGWRVWQTRVEYELIFALFLALGLYFIIAGLQALRFQPGLRWQKISRWLSGYSFTLYLTHFSVNSFLLIFKSKFNSLNWFILAFVGCNLVAMILAHFFERRSERLGKLYNHYFARAISKCRRFLD